MKNAKKFLAKLTPERRPDSLIMDSWQELKKLTTITTLGMLVAINVLLFLFFSIKLTDSIRVSLSYLPIALSGILFGPVGAGLAGIASDLINCYVKPMGPYFIGYTFSAMITGAIYGLLLYKKAPSLKRIIIAKVLILILVELLMNTTWSVLVYGSAMIAYIPSRMLKSLICFPIEVAMLYFVSKFAVLYKKARRAK